MTMEELTANKQYWEDKKAEYEVEKQKLEEERDNKYVALKEQLTTISTFATDIVGITSKTMAALNAGMVVANNKSFEEDELTKHSENMDKIVKNLDVIIKYCDKKIEEFNKKIEQKDKEIAYAQEKINLYAGLISEENNKNKPLKPTFDGTQSDATNQKTDGNKVLIPVVYDSNVENVLK